MASEIRVADISSGSCKSILFRAAQLGIEETQIGVKDKLEALKGICFTHKISLDEVCYIGDDPPDLPLIRQVGVSFAPADAWMK